MTASELFRFRTTRPIQSKQEGFTSLAVSTTVQTPQLRYATQLATAFPLSLGGLSWLETASRQLAASADEMGPGSVLALLPPTWATQITTPAWSSLQQTLADTLAMLMVQAKAAPARPGNFSVPIVPVSTAQNAELVARLLLLMDCIETLAVDQNAAPANKTFQTATDIQTALSFRSVSLPQYLFALSPANTSNAGGNTQSILARAPGVTDLSVVRDEWNRYVPGELANVTNVLPGETLASRSRHMEETVQAQSTVTQQTTTQTTENSQTTTQSLSSTATNDASANIGVHGQVETSGQYGPTNVKTNLGAQAQFSQSSSQSTALTKSVETVARAVKTVSQTIIQTQSTRTTTRDTIRQEHSLQNTTANVIVGQYRWLSEVHRVELVNYPNRFILEFEIPEPGAWLRYALANQVSTPWDNPDPGTFGANVIDPRLDPNDPSQPSLICTPLRPSDITPFIASGLAARWRAQGVTAPPPDTITIGNSYNVSVQTGGPIASNDNSITVPDGYVAQVWFVDAAFEGGNDNQHDTVVRIGVGTSGVSFVLTGAGASIFATGNQSKLTVSPVQGTPNGVSTTQVLNNISNGIPVGNISTGTLPVYVFGHYCGGDYPGGKQVPANVTFNITVLCSAVQVAAASPLSATISQPYANWQLTTFNTLSAAYDDLLQAHNQERDARLQNQSGPLVVGPPALNLSRAVAELKRYAIQNLLGQTFMGYDLLTIGPATPWVANTAYALGAVVPDSAGHLQQVIQPGTSGNSVPTFNDAGGITTGDGTVLWTDLGLGSLGSGEPEYAPANTVAPSPVIQFFEQAFEWENIVYICYPYFWGGHGRWLTNATSASADPTFDQFLNAGSARLVVPTRPGFEATVNYFLYTGQVWSGMNPPGPNDPGYLSIADEIQAIQVGAIDGTPIYPSWEVLLPTTLLWAGTDPSTLPTNPNATIPPPPTPPANVAFNVTSSVNPSVFGQPIAFTVTLSAATGSGGTPTGQVTFQMDSNPPGSPVTLAASGSATSAPVSTLTVGTHIISANYSGDTTYGSAMDNSFAQTVNQASATVLVSINPTAPSHTKPATVSATVTANSPATGIPTGQVSFQIDGNPVGSPVAINVSGVATLASTTLAKGSHTITVNYTGDPNFVAAIGTLSVKAS